MNLEFFGLLEKGDFSDASSFLQREPDLINTTDKFQRNGLFYALKSLKLDILELLISNGIEINKPDNDGNTPLHFCARAGLRPHVLKLLINKADWNFKNKQGQLASDLNEECKLFIEDLLPEKDAFGILDSATNNKIISIFKDIDFDDKLKIDFEKAVNFNAYIQKTKNTILAEKDAREFISGCAIINQESVSLDEWIFCFSKLYVGCRNDFDKFISDYEARVAEKRTIRENKEQ